MSDPAPAEPKPTLPLAEAVREFIAARRPDVANESSKDAPDDAQVWGSIGSLMGLSKADRQLRQREILDAFLAQWIAAGGRARVVDPKKARGIKRKAKVKQIKTRRAEVAKIVAANQKTPIRPVDSGAQ